MRSFFMSSRGVEYSGGKQLEQAARAEQSEYSGAAHLGDDAKEVELMIHRSIVPEGWHVSSKRKESLRLFPGRESNGFGRDCEYTSGQSMFRVVTLGRFLRELLATGNYELVSTGVGELPELVLMPAPAQFAGPR